MGWYDPAVLHALTAAAGTALEYATRALAPATLGVAIASSPALAENRRHPGGPTDPSIPGAAGRRRQRRRRSRRSSRWPRIPTVLGPENERLSPDYPGAARALVEARRGGVALFVAGPLGDQKPAGRDSRRRAGGSGRAGAQRARAGRAAGHAGGRGGRAGLARRGRAGRVRRDAATRRRRSTCGTPARAGSSRRCSTSRRGTRSPARAVLAAARLGGLRLLASPYELGVEVAARIRSRVPGPLMLVAHANDWLGYLLEPADFAAGGYESCLAFHGDDAALPFADAAVAAPGGAPRSAIRADLLQLAPPGLGQREQHESGQQRRERDPADHGRDVDRARGARADQEQPSRAPRRLRQLEPARRGAPVGGREELASQRARDGVAARQREDDRAPTPAGAASPAPGRRPARAAGRRRRARSRRGVCPLRSASRPANG